MLYYLVIFSIGAINALVPIIIIIILIAAAAGATRGFSIFNVFGIASLVGGGMGSVGGSSRGTAAKSGFPLRLLLDPGKPGMKGIVKVRKPRTPEGDPPARNAVGRWREITAAGRNRVTRLNIREGERQFIINKAGVGGGVRPVVIGNGPGWVKRVSIAEPEGIATVLGVKNRADAFKPSPMKVKETRMEAEKREIDKNIATISGGRTAEKAFEEATVRMKLLERLKKKHRMKLLERLKKKQKAAERVQNSEMASRSGNMIKKVEAERKNLMAEALSIYPGVAGLEKRRKLITEQENVIDEATRRLREGSMGDEEHRRVFASAMTRLYGPPDKSNFHRMLNPYYGTSVAYGGARASNIRNAVSRIGDNKDTAVSLTEYLKAGAPASISTGVRQVGVLAAARLSGEDRRQNGTRKTGSEIIRESERERANRLRYEVVPGKDPKLRSAIGERFDAYRKAHWDVNAAHERYRENAYYHEGFSDEYEKGVIKNNAPTAPPIKHKRGRRAVEQKEGPV